MAATEKIELLNNFMKLLREPLDPKGWKDRRKLVGESIMVKWKEELDHIGKFSEQHPKNYLFWDYRRWVIEKIGSDQPAIVIDYELEFTKKIFLSKGTKNYQAWSHREWLIQKFDTSLWQAELQYCHEILEKDIFNVSAWDQIYRAVRLNPNFDESKLEEAKYAKHAIYAQPGNEGPWIYLRLLYTKDPMKLCEDLDLECICADVLSRAAYLVESSVELDPQYKVAYASVENRGCIYALTLVADLLKLGYQPKRNPRLVEAVDVLAKSYCFSYLSVYQIEKEMGKEFSLKVRALMNSLNAYRIRYCYLYRGHQLIPNPRTYEKVKLRHEMEQRRGEEEQPCGEEEQPCGQKEQPCGEEEQPCGEEEQPCGSRGIYNSLVDDSHRSNITEDFLDSLFDQPIFNDLINFYPEWEGVLHERRHQIHLRAREHSIIGALTKQEIHMDIRRFVVKKIGTVALAELHYCTHILKNDANNHTHWSYRQWLFQTFGRDWEDEAELDFCGEILKEDSCNSFAWDQRYFVALRWVRKIDEARSDLLVDHKTTRAVVEVFRDRLMELGRIEFDYAIKAIVSEPENPFPWGHIAGLDAISCGRLFSDLKVRNGLMRVLEDTRDCVVGLDAGDVVTGCARDASLMNPIGVMNAINMLFDMVVIRSFDTKLDEYRGLREVMEALCPDSSLVVVFEDKCGIAERLFHTLTKFARAFGRPWFCRPWFGGP